MYYKAYHYFYWMADVEYNGKIYNVFIESHEKVVGSDFWYLGGIRNTDAIKTAFVNDWIEFGYSDYVNDFRYILEAMKKVIEGDYSSIKGVGHCIDKPNNNRIRKPVLGL